MAWLREHRGWSARSPRASHRPQHVDLARGVRHRHVGVVAVSDSRSGHRPRLVRRADSTRGPYRGAHRDGVLGQRAAVDRAVRVPVRRRADHLAHLSRTDHRLDVDRVRGQAADAERLPDTDGDAQARAALQGARHREDPREPRRVLRQGGLRVGRLRHLVLRARSARTHGRLRGRYPDLSPVPAALVVQAARGQGLHHVRPANVGQPDDVLLLHEHRLSDRRLVLRQGCGRSVPDRMQDRAQEPLPP